MTAVSTTPDECLDVDAILVNLVGEVKRLLEELVVVHQEVDDRHPVLDLIHDVRILGDLLEGEALDGSLGLLEVLNRVVVERVVTPHADRLILRGLLPTVRAQDRRVVLRVFRLDVLPVELGVLGGAVVAVHRDVVRDRVAPALAALAVLDEALVLSEFREPGRVALPEVLRRDRLFDANTAGSALEVAHERGVAHPLAVVLRPEGRVIVARAWMMVAQIPVQVRNGENHRHGALAGLPIDLDFSAVIGLLDVADAELIELAVGAEPALELDGEQCLVSSVVGAVVDEWKDVLLPVEHVCSRGLRVVIAGRVRGHPFDGLRWITSRPPSECVLSEGADGESVVALRPRVVVGAVNPADNLLRGFALFEGVCQATDLLRSANGMTEKLLVSVVRVVMQVELVGDSEECVDVIVANGIVSVLLAVVEVRSSSRPDSVAEGVDQVTLAHTSSCSKVGQDLTIWLESRPRLFSRYKPTVHHL